jgi:hypothetical protein
VKHFLGFTLLGSVAVAALPAMAVDREEGSYAGQKGQAMTRSSIIFLKHFNYDQYYWGYQHQWTWNNDARVDAMDFAIFAGHGNGQWLIALLGSSVSLTTAGSGSSAGYGNVDAEFVAFESCKVVPKPLEQSDWYSNWTSGSDDVFDRLHQALGFRTDSYQSTDERSPITSARVANNTVSGSPGSPPSTPSAQRRVQFCRDAPISRRRHL